MLGAGEKGTHEADGVLVRAEGAPGRTNGGAPLEQVFGAGLAHVAQRTRVGWVLSVGNVEWVGVSCEGRGKLAHVFVVAEDANLVK